MRKRILRSKTATRMVVHLTDDSSVGGFLTQEGLDGIVLSAACLLPDEGGAVPLSGDLYVPYARVKFVQLQGEWEGHDEPM